MKPHLELVLSSEEEREVLRDRLRQLCYEVYQHRLSNKLMRSAVNALELILGYKADRVIRAPQQRVS